MSGLLTEVTAIDGFDVSYTYQGPLENGHNKALQERVTEELRKIHDLGSWDTVAKEHLDVSPTAGPTGLYTFTISLKFK
jgi:hypothetical protein